MGELYDNVVQRGGVRLSGGVSGLCSKGSLAFS